MEVVTLIELECWNRESCRTYSMAEFVASLERGGYRSTQAQQMKWFHLGWSACADMAVSAEDAHDVL